MTVSLQELFDAGAHLGHQAQKWHPRIKPWIYCEQDGIHIFDLEKTLQQLELAKKRLQELKVAGKSVIVVATKKQASEIVMDLATQAKVMYVVNRWPGGLITNWEQVRKSIKRMNDIEAGLAGDKYQDYTKYERLLLEKQLSRLKRLFGGLKELKNKPDALLVIDGMKERNAVAEAMKEGVELIGLIDSNTDPTGINLPIPANDDALSSIRLIVAEILGVATSADRKQVVVIKASQDKETTAENKKAAGEEVVDDKVTGKKVSQLAKSAQESKTKAKAAPKQAIKPASKSKQTTAKVSKKASSKTVESK